MPAPQQLEPFEVFLDSWSRRLLRMAMMPILFCAVITIGFDSTSPLLGWPSVILRLAEFGVTLLLIWMAQRSKIRSAVWFIIAVSWFGLLDSYLNAALAGSLVATGCGVMLVVAIGLFPVSIRELPFRLAIPAAASFLGTWLGGVHDLGSTIALYGVAVGVGGLMAVMGRSLAQRAFELRREVVEASLQAKSDAESRATFMRSLSHEMRTPLHGLVGLMQEIRLGPLGGRQAEALAMADQAAHLLDMLVGDALAHSDAPPDVQVRSVHALVPIRAALASAREPHRIEVTHGPPGPVDLDPRRVQQVVQLLMSYVGEAPGNRAARVGVKWKKDRLRLNIYGVGQGGVMHAEGLSGALVARVVEVLGGELRETVGADCHVAHVSLPAPLSDPKLANLADLEGRVLVVDDNRLNRMVLRGMAERLGATVDEVADGREALVKLADHPYAIVLMDIDMPVMDGIEATTRARRRGFTCPIVAVTANGDEDTRQAALVSGMDGFLTKPLRVEDLAPVLSTALRSRQTVSTVTVRRVAG